MSGARDVAVRCLSCRAFIVQPRDPGRRQTLCSEDCARAHRTLQRAGQRRRARVRAVVAELQELVPPGCAGPHRHLSALLRSVDRLPSHELGA